MSKKLTKTFQRFISLLAINELSESNRIIKFLGGAFIILAILYLFGFVKVSTIIVICISLSGICFIIGDIFEHLCKVQNQKKAIDFKIRQKRISYFKLAKATFHFLAIISLIIAPYITFNLTKEFLEKLSNVLSMLAIGLTLFKIGLDNAMKQSEFEIMLMEELLNLEKEKILTTLDIKKEDSKL